MIILAILTLLLVLLTWLLLAPCELRIDTRKELYRLRWRTLARAEGLLREGEPVVLLRIGPWRHHFYPLRLRSRPGKKAAKPKPQPAKRKRGSLSWRQIRALLRSFRVRTCRLDLDTGDYVRNAWLFPLFYFLRTRHAAIQINFQGRNELELWVETRLLFLLTAFLKGTFKFKIP